MIAAGALGCAGRQRSGGAAPSADEIRGPLEDGPIEGGVGEAELALTLGDPARALKILATVPEGDPTYAYAKDLTAIAREDAESIAEDWLVEVDTLIAVQRYRAARARCRHLLKRFPLNEDQDRRAREYMVEIDEQVEAGRKRLEETEERAREYLLSNDLEGALRELRDARTLAWELDRGRALSWERIIAATDIRYQAALADGSISSGSDQGTSSVRRRVRRRVSSSPNRISADSKTPGDAAGVEALLKQAKQAGQNNSYFDAIRLYLAVLRKSASHSEATEALKQLEPKRAQLIQEYLSRANQYFLRQDLGGAKPYYERVLILQPGHKRALEGIRMYEQLEKIKSQKKR